MTKAHNKMTKNLTKIKMKPESIKIKNVDKIIIAYK